METNREKTRKGLSRKETVLLSTLSERGKRILTLEDIAEAGNTYANAKKIAHDLAEKGWLTRLKRGLYLIVPLAAGRGGRYTEDSLIIASHLAEPYYIAYWTALNYHGLTEQAPRVTQVATTKKVRNRRIQGVKYEFSTLVPRKFFGFKKTWIKDKKVNISTMEKTIADCLDHPERCGGVSEVIKALITARNELDFEKLTSHAVAMESGAILKRLGYLAEKLELPVNLEKLQENLTKGYSPLDTVARKEGKHVSKWKLVVNATVDKAKREVET